LLYICTIINKTIKMKTTENLIKKVEERLNVKFDWGNPRHRTRLKFKIDRELEKLNQIEKIFNK